MKKVKKNKKKTLKNTLKKSIANRRRSSLTSILKGVTSRGLRPLTSIVKNKKGGNKKQEQENANSSLITATLNINNPLNSYSNPIPDTIRDLKQAKQSLKNTIHGKTDMFKSVTDLKNKTNYLEDILKKIPLPFNIEQMLVISKMIINNVIAFMLEIKEMLKETILDNPNEMAINFIIRFTGLFCNQRVIFENIYTKLKKYIDDKLKEGSFLGEADSFNNNIYTTIINVYDNFYLLYDKLCVIRNKLIAIQTLLQEQTNLNNNQNNNNTELSVLPIDNTEKEQTETVEINKEEKEEDTNNKKCPSKNKEPISCKDKKDYLKQTLIFHPDKNTDCQDEATFKFQKLQEVCKEVKTG